MPFYTWTRPQNDDDERTLEMKLRAVQKLKILRKGIKKHIKNAKLSEGVTSISDKSMSVRIATWNIREFDSSSYGRRTKESKSYIAEILSHFDLIAIQEIRRDIKPLKDVLKLLGPNWDFIATDVTEGSSGNKERMAYLFNKNKVLFQNIAGELTLPKGKQVTDPFGKRLQLKNELKLELPEGKKISTEANLKFKTYKDKQKKLKEDVEINVPKGTKVVLPEGSSIRFPSKSIVPFTEENKIDIEQTSTPILPKSVEIVLPSKSFLGFSKQFARTPFIASFQAGWLKVNLATVHIYYGKGKAGIARRTEEIKKLTKLLSERAQSDIDSDAESYFIALGDFNIVNPEHQTMDALESNEFEVLEALKEVPGTNVKKDKHYDQIALWKGKSSKEKTYTSIVPYRAGVFDFFEYLYTESEESIYKSYMKKKGKNEYYKSFSKWRTYQMSDHLPMWVELRIDFSEEYLDEMEKIIETKLK